MFASTFTPIDGPPGKLRLIRATQSDGIVHLLLVRPDKRNAINDEMLAQLYTALVHLPGSAKVAIVSGEGEHFCAGFDGSELTKRGAHEGFAHSRLWHAAFDLVQFGRVPVIAVLHGAVVGGGLELASSAHVRVAERSAFYALPQSQRGINDGGGSARIPNLVGVSRMIDMMLTGRNVDAAEGHEAGLSHYLVEPGQGFAYALRLARRVAGNAPLTNSAVMQALPRIAQMSQPESLSRSHALRAM